MLLLLLLTAICGMHLVCCSLAVATNGTGGISGSVVLSETRRPVWSALVRIPEAGRDTVSGRDGKFRFDGLHPGTYTVEVSRVLLATRNARTTVEVRAGEVAQVEVVVDQRGLSDAAAAMESIGVDVPEMPVNLKWQVHSQRGSYKLGEKPGFVVQAINHSDRAIVLVPSLDGSTAGIRYPHVSIQVYGPDMHLATPAEWHWCGNLNGLGVTEMVRVGPGESFDPFGKGWQPEQKAFERPGRYTAVFRYSTMEPDVRKWLGDASWAKHLPQEISRRFRMVPMFEDSCSVQFEVRR